MKKKVMNVFLTGIRVVIAFYLLILITAWL